MTYGYNYYDENYYSIKSSKPLTAGRPEVKLVYEAIAGATPNSPTAKVNLFIDGVKTGEGTIGNIVQGKYSISEPFDVGVDNGGSVIRSAYASPYKFSDNLDKVIFELN